jgi:hypothetical protein
MQYSWRYGSKHTDRSQLQPPAELIANAWPGLTVEESSLRVQVAALARLLIDKGLLQRMRRSLAAPPLAQALDRGDLPPLRCRYWGLQDWMPCPSSSTVQHPHTPAPQPNRVPLSFRSLRRT